MKKNANDIYYLGTYASDNKEMDYYFNNNTGLLSRWTRIKGEPEKLEKSLPMSQLPSVFAPLFDIEGKIILEKEKKSRKKGDWT